MAAATALETFATAVLVEAQLRYDEGGWDVLVECWTVDELVNHWTTLAEDGISVPTSVEEAVASVKPLVAVWADRQADAINSAF